MMFKIIDTGLITGCLVALLYALSGFADNANTRIAVLAFDLKDLTLIQDSRRELDRTASIKPLLTAALGELGQYELVPVNPEVQATFERGYGYLFSHHDVAADLGEKVGTEYVVVGRLHKPSALFVYLMAHLVDVKSATVVGDYIVEVKGTQTGIMEKGVEALAKQIHETLQPRLK